MSDIVTSSPVCEDLGAEQAPWASVAVRRAANAVDRLLDLAKCDKRGVYWQLASKYRHLDPARMDTSLAAGTCGIILALSEYHRATADRSVLEVIAKALSWHRERLKTAGFTPGFYFGSGGACYLVSAVRDAVPDMIDAESAAKMAPLRVSSAGVRVPDHSGAALGMGWAGSFVGACALGGEEGKQLAGVAATQITRKLRFSQRGISWDYYPHVVRAPIGFLSGSAGIEYAVAGASRLLGEEALEILAHSIANSNSHFDGNQENWTDYEATGSLARLGRDGMFMAVMRARGEMSREALMVDDTMGWGSGTAGILLSRVKIADIFQGHPIARVCQGDCLRALARLGRATDQELLESGPYLENGVTGIALSLKAFQKLQGETGLPLVHGLERRIFSVLETMSEDRRSDDPSLLTGTAGLAYAWLKLASAEPGKSCLNPLGEVSPVPQTAAYCADDVRRRIIEKTLTRTAALWASRGVRSVPALNLPAIQEASAECRAGQVLDHSAEAAQHELDLLGEFAEVPSFRHLMMREGFKKAEYEKRYGEGMTSALLTSYFVLDAEVSLKELRFDPADPSVQLTENPTSWARYRSSKGVVERRLSSFEFALLKRFRTPTMSLDAVHRVVGRVKNQASSPAQVTAIGVATLRVFVAEGFLFPASVSLARRITDWLRLFPVNARYSRGDGKVPRANDRDGYLARRSSAKQHGAPPNIPEHSVTDEGAF